MLDMQRNVDILEETGATSRRTTRAEEAPVVQTPKADVRPSATEATAKVQTKREEEKTGRDIFAMDRSHQQRSN